MSRRIKLFILFSLIVFVQINSFIQPQKISQIQSIQSQELDDFSLQDFSDPNLLLQNSEVRQVLIRLAKKLQNDPEYQEFLAAEKKSSFYRKFNTTTFCLAGVVGFVYYVNKFINRYDCVSLLCLLLGTCRCPINTSTVN